MRGMGVWVLTLAAMGGNAQAGDVFRGKVLYERHCVDCHGPSGEGRMPGMPNFSHGDRLVTKPNDRLIESIRGGIGLMPGYAAILNEQDMQDVMAYVRTLM